MCVPLYRQTPPALPVDQRTRVGLFVYRRMKEAIYPTVSPSAMGFIQGWEQEPLWQ